MAHVERSSFLTYYWTHYIICEKDLRELGDYIAFRECNLSTCSNRIIELYMNVVIGIESTIKLLYPSVSKTFHSSQFTKALLQDKTFDYSQKVTHLHAQFLPDFAPFESLNPAAPSVPTWWTSYNAVKHNRMDNFEEGNLGNLLQASGAYFYLLNLYLKENAKRWERAEGKQNCCYDLPDPLPTMFKLVNWQTSLQPGTIYISSNVGMVGA